MPTPTTPHDFVPHLDSRDRLSLIYASPGPYVSVYLQTRPLLREAEHDTTTRWQVLRTQLVADEAPTRALEAIDARLALPQPTETAAIGIIAAADGSTVVDHALEPPRQDLATVDTLPYAAPMIEWDQRRVPHLVVVVDGNGADVVSFHPDHRTETEAIDGVDDVLADAVQERVSSLQSRLVVVSGEPGRAQMLADALVPRVGPACNVVLELDEGVDALAAATVRQVSDSVATRTVGLLREFRFLATHDAAVDGMEETLDALRSRRPGVLLIHDDPADERRVWLGDTPTDLHVAPALGRSESARFVDAAIRAAITAGMRVHVIPTTGRNGPDDGAAHLHRGTPAVEPV
ncbi:MAG: hypothetical protein R2707_17490 [Acidimicrobiales bacterium]